MATSKKRQKQTAKNKSIEKEETNLIKGCRCTLHFDLNSKKKNQKGKTKRLRQAIESQLNKVELANRFTRAVAVGNPSEFPQVDKEKQEIAEASNQFIKDAIIC